MTDLDPSFVPRPSSDVSTADLDGELVLWRAGVIHRLDPVASVAWRCFDGRATARDIADDLAVGFGVDHDRVAHDVFALCERLLDAGVLEGGTEPGTPDELPWPLGAEPWVGPGPRPGDAGELDSLEFAHRTGTLQALSHRFAIRSNDAELGAYVERLLGAFSVPGSAAHTYSVVDRGHSGRERWALYLDRLDLVALPDAEAAVKYLLWHINLEVIRLADAHLLVHASAAAKDGRAVIIPGGMNAGKTTLVAGLVLAGFGYLTDEAVAFDVESGRIDPYPRPLNVEPGSWPLLPELEPRGWTSDDRFARSRWVVDIRDVRPDAVAGPAMPRFVIIPDLERGAAPRLEPVSRADTLELLSLHTFNGATHGRRGFLALAEGTAGSSCWRLVTGELPGAVRLVTELVNATT